MIMTADRANTQATCPEMPDESMRIIAEGLAKRGLTVRTTRCEDSRLLKVTGTGKAACDVTVADDCGFTCEYIARRSRRSSPADTARVVARMLGTDYANPQQYAHLHRGVTSAGAIGREMKARGMTVAMNVIEDEEIYDVIADVVITNPVQPERGEVHVGNDDWVYWECYGDEIADGPADLATTVAEVLARSAFTARDRLAVVYGACRRAVVCRHRPPGSAGGWPQSTSTRERVAPGPGLTTHQPAKDPE
jgi:hypothetical protein